ncbi:hypothetical protein EN871_07565 [bacterium M00.F.Ca.ET.228.01.1.1]|nr:hypothetical protein EN871_07565 [bacterium M00.F.Ca.ET.228.01.1.1]TGS03794.1 hypothetical protein EN834_05420 [bacterium M00.F.Ca.ET.191.01.1.1]TGU07586.1 hypothetical protein EN798_11640 [bacterium M00.F.Ca.ET.155.01.1.1]
MHFLRAPGPFTAFLAVLPITLAGCGGAANQQPSISGSVYLGPVAGANVAAYAIDANGHAAATPVATIVTDANGHFVLPRALHWPLLVRASGGTYIEEATGASASAGQSELTAVYVREPSSMVITPYSTAVVTDAMAAGGLTASNVAAASARVSAFLGGIDPQQTAPAFVAPGATAGALTDGNRMALALGAESQSRADNDTSVAASVQYIVAQAAKGDTLAACHAGAGDVAADGSLAAPADDTCHISSGAANFAANPLNRSGVTTLSMLGTTAASGPQTASASANACGDRVALLEQNRWLFEGRKNSVQASLVPGMTSSNWSTYPTTSTWGPHAAIYGTISAPSACTNLDTFRRELVMAIENYWVDQNLNYCHHHIPGWTPPENTASTDYRDSSAGSTSGGSSDPHSPKMTCTAQRGADGSQSVQTSTAQTPAVIGTALMWNGADCSNFTSWVYNFAGLATNQLSGAIGVQACSTPASGTDPLTGVLLDINRGNLSSMEQYLLPGDLLYITQKDTVGSGSFAADYKLAHVITWTGKRFSDLQAGADRAKYDLSRIGQPDSRLGGDFLALLGPTDTAANLGQPGHDPWMIIDSHYAGPAYRPFLGWYAERLSHVRRIVGADQVASDPHLADYVIKPLPPTRKGWLTLASKHANASSTSGFRLIYQTGGTQSCYQAGTP